MRGLQSLFRHDLKPLPELPQHDGTQILVGLLEAIDPHWKAGICVLKRRDIGRLADPVALPETQEM